MSAKYDAARQAFGEGTLSWTRDRLFGQLLGSDYVFSEKHTTPAQLGSARIGDPVELTGKTIARGYARCGTIAFKRVPGPRQAVAYAIYRDHPASNGGQLLVAFIDGVDGFPMLPNGGDILIDPPETGGLFRV